MYIKPCSVKGGLSPNVNLGTEFLPPETQGWSPPLTHLLSTLLMHQLATARKAVKIKAFFSAELLPTTAKAKAKSCKQSRI